MKARIYEPSIGKTLLRALLVLAVLLVTSSCSSDPGESDPVGRLHLALEDPERTNWSGDGLRPIQATVWYPASPEVESREWQAGVFRFGQSALNAPFLDQAKRPLIMVSHGTGGTAAQMSWLAEQLAAAGFIVAGVNHHGNTATEGRQWPAGFVQPWERSRDISVLIDRLVEHPEIGPRIDRRRIGAAGFSLGGYSVLGLLGVQFPSFETWLERCRERPESHACRLPPEADFTLEEVESMRRTDPSFQAGLIRGEDSFRDDRVSAVYAMAPALISLLSENDMAVEGQAIRIVLAAEDEQIELAETMEVVDKFLPTASLWVIEGARHYTFLAPCTLRGRLFARSLCGDRWGVDRQDIHARVGRDAIAFFGSKLNNGAFQEKR